MAENVYKVVELVGTSADSWENAAATAVEIASKILRDLTAPTSYITSLQKRRRQA